MHNRLAVVVLSLIAVPSLLAQDAAIAVPKDPLRDTVRGAIAWIARQAIPVRGVEGAVLFPASEGSKMPPATNVYGGSAGVSIFLENAAAVLDDASARELADRAMKGLKSARHVDSRDHASWAKGQMMGADGLYTGDAGVGQAFLVRHLLRHDAEALTDAIDVGDALIARARTDDNEMSWGTQEDIIFGDAGTALFLLELGQASKEKRFLDAAKAVGHSLVAAAAHAASKADPAKQLPVWMFHMGGKELHMPNFSHGTAGVAYALVRIGAALGDDALLQAGKEGAQWLIENAVADGECLKWVAREGSKPVYMGGWCHGPAGTGRLFLLLASVTGEARYLEVAKKSAGFVVEYAANAERTAADGTKPYVPPSFCCGVAGVTDFFCDLSRVTHDPAHVAFAKKAANYIVDVSIADGDGRKWKNGQSVPGGPVAADSSGHNVELMLGAAGEALALLRVITLDSAVDPVHAMPDRVVTVPAKK
jgi:lantibiotic modifying enzyme